MRNYLTIDVEDYYQVSAFDDLIKRDDWVNYESRVVKNTKIILALLARYDTKATFFVLGWIAEKHPELVQMISSSGHEVACHSYLHRLVYNLNPDEFYEDTQKAKDILEQITGEAVKGYRAPSYSIDKNSLWAFEILQELGFVYDSSIFPISHDRYGNIDSPRFMYKMEGTDLIEFPISTALVGGVKIPVSGGGYFRFFPYSITEKLLGRINSKENKSFVFYLHPWEFDPGQPTIHGAKRLSGFRHYLNLHKTESRFENLLRAFRFTSFNNSI
ncbi:MAG: DUF3473 domain-containing protein [Candidatus Thiodiazotropha sp. (ex Epidulcina cf. delphinae)]|nr:DUF3473 domain-containing protein [Candidatus Thiodiazotropha sp. (ex Epidulcina cf. delphinae)]